VKEGRRIFWSIFDSSWEFCGIVQVGLVESKMAIEGRQIIMLLGPNKMVVAKLQATAQLSVDKSKNKGQDKGKLYPESTVTEEPKEISPLLVDT
jgi:hypothetical protein